MHIESWNILTIKFRIFWFYDLNLEMASSNYSFGDHYDKSYLLEIQKCLQPAFILLLTGHY